MTQYFFNLCEGERIILHDCRGEQIRARDIHRHARLKARDYLAAALFADESYETRKVDVTTEQGAIIFSLPLLDALKM